MLTACHRGVYVLPADALHAYIFRLCGFLRRNCFSFACISPIIYALSANALQTDAFSHVGLVRRNVFGVVGSLITHELPADALRASDFGRCGFLCRNVHRGCLMS